MESSAAAYFTAHDLTCGCCSCLLLCFPLLSFLHARRVNNQMSLSDFKFIYLMEFSHRLLGRGVGIAFALPGLYFLLKGRINSRLAARLGLAFVAGGTQGAIGWWMVRSGLENPHETKQSGQVHVSPYRLATHLISAFGIYSLLFTTALRVHPSRYSHSLSRGNADWAALRNFFQGAPVRQLRLLAAVTTGVVACTVFSGAFVAGNEAGLVYNEFPLMGGRLIPEDIVSPYIQPKWRNAFENSTTVQFEHRVMALTTTALAIAVFVASKRAGRNPLVQHLTKSSPLVQQRFRNIQKASHAVLGMVSVQVSLGIATLLLYVPVPLATLHQAGSLTLLTFSLWLLYTTRDPTGRKLSGQLMQLWAKSNAGSKQAAAAEFLKLQAPGTAQQLANVFRDLSQGRVHKGTALVTLALLLIAATGYSASQLYELTQKEQEQQKKNKAITA